MKKSPDMMFRALIVLLILTLVMGLMELVAVNILTGGDMEILAPMICYYKASISVIVILVIIVGVIILATNGKLLSAYKYVVNGIRNFILHGL